MPGVFFLEASSLPSLYSDHGMIRCGEILFLLDGADPCLPRPPCTRSGGDRVRNFPCARTRLGRPRTRIPPR
jgi:hypothetical protein